MVTANLCSHNSLFCLQMNNCFTAFVYDVYVTAELLSGLRKEVESGRLPSNIADRMEEVYHNYRNAVSNQI